MAAKKKSRPIAKKGDPSKAMPEESPKKQNNPLDGSDYPLSPALEKEREKTEIPVSGRHMPARIIIFFVLLITGIAFIVLSILGFFSVSSGLQEIQVAEDSDYNAGTSFHFFYYLDGQTREVNAKSSEISTAYTKVMKDAYRMSDDQTVYNDCIGLAYLAAHPDTDIPIDSRLYAALEDVLSDSSGVTSLYYGPLYREWEKIIGFSQEASLLSDPLFDATEKEFFSSYLALLEDKDSISLSLLGGNKVRFHVSTAYQAWMTEYEYSGPTLSFGPMRNAYRADMVKQAMLENGYQNGVLFSDDGLMMSLGGLNNLSTNLYGFNGSYLESCGAIELGGFDTLSYVRLSPLGSNHDEVAYSFADEGKTYLRNLVLNNDGMGADYLSGLTLLESGNKPSQVKRRSLALALSKDEAALKQNMTSLVANPIYTLNEATKAVYVPSSLDRQVLPEEGTAWSIQTYEKE